MKKIISAILVIVFCLSALCGCTTDKPETSASNTSVDASSADISYDEVSYFIPGETSKPGESNDSSESNTSTENSQSTEISQPPVQQTGGFEIKSKTYAYQNSNVEILDIKNASNKNYSLTIKASYLDVNGKVLKTETQEWEQFASGYQKYFLFQPNIKFDSFIYELEAKEFNGECIVFDLDVSNPILIEKQMSIMELVNQGDHERYPAIVVNVNTINKGNKTLQTGFFRVITIGNDGNIFSITQLGITEYEPYMENDRTSTIYYTTDENLVWPDVLKGNIQIVLVIDSISNK